MTDKQLQELWDRLCRDISGYIVPTPVWNTIRSMQQNTGASFEDVLAWLNVKRKGFSKTTGRGVTLSRVVQLAAHDMDGLDKYAKRDKHGPAGKPAATDEEVIRYTSFLETTLKAAVASGASMDIELYRPTSPYPAWFRVWKCNGNSEILNEYMRDALKDAQLNPTINARVTEAHANATRQ